MAYSTGPLSAEKASVSVSAFGSKPDGCDTLPVVVAHPEDGCSPLLNAEQVWREGFAGRARKNAKNITPARHASTMKHVLV